jgi:phosphatidylglycerophosphatase A
MKRLGLVLATAGGAGYAPVAPGTFGSAVGVFLYWLLLDQPLVWQAAALVLVSVAGIWAGDVAIRHFGRDDPSQVVIDEVAGQFLTLLATGATGWGMLVGFLVFRALDITKPWPARSFERLHGGLGIMADDLMAGLYGHLVIRLLVAARPGLF